MAKNDVGVHPVPHKIGGYVLHLFHEGRYIGEYKDSRAGDEDREAMRDYAKGVFFVELAPLSEPELVAQAVASVVRAREAPGQPLARTLAAHFASRRLLLVLDNCEHLVVACASLEGTLLAGTPIAHSLRPALPGTSSAFKSAAPGLPRVCCRSGL